MSNLPVNFFHGIMAGLLTTILLSFIFVVKTQLGLFPNLDPVASLSNMSIRVFSDSNDLMMGWLLHFLIGSIGWGGAFAFFNHIIPGHNQLIKGIYLGLATWLLMMFGFMPIAEKGILGLSLGVMTPVITLFLHLIFGITLGLFYKKLER